MRVPPGLRSACGALLLTTVPAAWLLLIVAHGVVWWAGGVYGAPPESWALMLLLAGYTYLACVAGVRLLAPRGERVRGLARRCARGMAYLLGTSAVAFALAFLCRQGFIPEDTGELAVLKVAFTHQVQAKLDAQAPQELRSAVAGSARDPNVYVGSERDGSLVPWLRQKYPALQFLPLSGIPQQQVLPMGREANVADVDRVMAIGPVTFPLWNVAAAPWRISACTGRMTFIRLGGTWRVMSSAADFCI